VILSPAPRLVLVLLSACLLPASVDAQEPQDPDEKQRRARLAGMSIEELMSLEVTTVARKEQKLIDAPSAVYVIRGEDIRRTGTRSIAEALRMVPGVQVARIDANKWAVGARGFADRFANKLQVLVDGRTVYSPVFSGVLWDQQDTMIEDIDRIEVVRGPGATVWGSNAVNGVVNVITKKARETQGGLIVAGGGTEEQDFGAVRYGAKSAGDLHARVFARYFNRHEGRDGHDDWFQARGGFRADWTPGPDTFTFSGEYFDGKSRGVMTVPVFSPPFTQTFVNGTASSGGHFIARWERELTPASELSAQLTYDHVDIATDFYEELRDTLELDLRHRFSPLEGHDVVWGAGHRLTTDDITGSSLVSFSPPGETDGLLNVFAQDEVTLFPNRLSVTLGSKFEYNDHTGFEYQPGARILWKPDERQAVWASVSRAVHIPSRSDDDVTFLQAVFPAGPTLTGVYFLGNRDVRSEELLATEAGYRIQPLDTVSLDVALFYNDYDDLLTAQPGAPYPNPSAPPPDNISPLDVSNMRAAKTYGVETAVTWRASDQATLHASYTFLRRSFTSDPGSLDPTSDKALEDRNPRHSVYARLSLNPIEDLEIDVIGRFMDESLSATVKSHTELDARIGWWPLKTLEVAVVGQNLLHSGHYESGSTVLGEAATQVERGVYVVIGWRF
jgi:iron complex outermembrane receptor protein